jgi:hypothetical protein
MKGIGPLDERDLPEVASLYERVVRSGSKTPPPKLAAYFRRTFLKHPWIDPEIPSLVYRDDEGRIAGFLGSHVRRLRFDGRPIRMACSGQLVVAPEARHEAVGAFITQEYLAGPQELSITDGANEPVRRMWQLLGAEVLHLSSIDWTRVFRPLGVAREYAGRRRRPVLAYALAPLAAVVDAVATRLPGKPFRVARPPGSVEELTPDALVEHLADVTSTLRLYPDYDEAFADWVFREMADVRSRGKLVRCLVRGEDGHVLGWFVVYVRRGGVSDAVQVVAVDKAVGKVLDHLFHETFRRGASAVRGRIEPRLLPELWGRRCVLRFSEGALAHSRSPEILRALRAGEALLTRMDGEWWMGHHLEAFA